MNSERIDSALQQASDTRCVMIGDGALDAVDTVLGQCFDDKPAVLVADGNTWDVAGAAVMQRLRAAGRRVANAIVFPATPVLYADMRNVLALEEQLQAIDAVPLVVGSGTLNDITKLAAHRAGRQYMVVGTAASMDGYTAFGAAITRDGFKQTMSCPAPRAVLADLAILARAPAAMSATGYGDLLGKVTAGADWILADALHSEPIDAAAWPLVQDRLREWTAQPERIRVGDGAAIASLFEGLVMAGIAMQISGSSRPASGSEHRFSHLWEMQALVYGHPAVPHGFKVGVGTIAAAALYERILERDLEAIDVEALVSAWPSRDEIERQVRAAHELPGLAENAVAESLAKEIEAGQLRGRLELLRQGWPALRERLRAQLLPAQQLRELLRAAGCPTDPRQIGVDYRTLQQSYALARTIRARYTVLDLAYEAGVLDTCVDELFAPGGFWNNGSGQ